MSSHTRHPVFSERSAKDVAVSSTSSAPCFLHQSRISDRAKPAHAMETRPWRVAAFKRRPGLKTRSLFLKTEHIFWSDGLSSPETSLANAGVETFQAMGGSRRGGVLADYFFSASRISSSSTSVRVRGGGSAGAGAGVRLIWLTIFTNAKTHAAMMKNSMI